MDEEIKPTTTQGEAVDPASVLFGIGDLVQYGGRFGTVIFKTRTGRCLVEEDGCAWVARLKAYFDPRELHRHRLG